MIDSESDERLREEVRKEYRLIGSVWCPYLGNVSFEEDGLDHLFYKSSHAARSLAEQWSRARALQKAVHILKRSGTLQEFTQKNIFVRQRKGTKWNKILRLVCYSAFIAIIDDRRYKVIVRGSGGGNWKFFSVFPLSKDGTADFSEEK